jgi:protein-S-isoprenylcysteine O-methyltransferase Ste14
MDASIAATNKYPASKFRIAVSRVLAACLIVLVFFNEDCWSKSGFVEIFFESLGLILVAVGSFGRLWASLYIGGYKNDRLITCGPYSVTRNPLYFFSFVGIVGIGLSARSFIIPGLLILGFSIYYPWVIREEEIKLKSTHPEEFERYKSVPRFLPNPSLYHEPETYVVNTRRYVKCMLDCSFFLWTYMALHIVEKLHAMNVIPVFFRMP